MTCGLGLSDLVFGSPKSEDLHTGTADQIPSTQAETIKDESWGFVSSALESLQLCSPASSGQVTANQGTLSPAAGVGLTVPKRGNGSVPRNEGLCRKGWLPIILEEDDHGKENQVAQKVCDSDAMVSGREVGNVAAMSSTCIPFSSDADLLWQQSTAPENALTDGKESEGEECLHLTALNSHSSPLEFVSSLGTPVNSCSMDSVLGPSVIHGEGTGVAKPLDALPTWKVQHHNLSPQAHLMETSKREISPAFMVDIVSPADEKVFLEVSSRELESELVEKGLSESKDADAARRARINSIFLLCGDRREIAAKTYTSPRIQGHQTELAEELSSARFSGHLQSDSLAESLTHEKADQSISAFSTSPCLSETTSTDVSSLPSPLPAVSPQRFTSPGRLKRRFTESPYANENTPQPKHGKGKCDVYVKWETSKDPAGGKLICIVSTVKSASLAELREEVEAHIPIAKKNFAFLILGVCPSLSEL
jgi:hypothetical protein